MSSKCSVALVSFTAITRADEIPHGSTLHFYELFDGTVYADISGQPDSHDPKREADMIIPRRAAITLFKQLGKWAKTATEDDWCCKGEAKK